MKGPQFFRSSIGGGGGASMFKEGSWTFLNNCRGAQKT